MLKVGMQPGNELDLDLELMQAQALVEPVLAFSGQLSILTGLKSLDQHKEREDREVKRQALAAPQRDAFLKIRGLGPGEDMGERVDVRWSTDALKVLLETGLSRGNKGIEKCGRGRQKVRPGLHHLQQPQGHLFWHSLQDLTQAWQKLWVGLGPPQELLGEGLQLGRTDVGQQEEERVRGGDKLFTEHDLQLLHCLQGLPFAQHGLKQDSVVRGVPRRVRPQMLQTREQLSGVCCAFEAAPAVEHEDVCWLQFPTAEILQYFMGYGSERESGAGHGHRKDLKAFGRGLEPHPLHQVHVFETFLIVPPSQVHQRVVHGLCPWYLHAIDTSEELDDLGLP
mmetsp:Transcript_62201/g.110889  ORF Transcript_62201/g.110889 Transcript_62201/m.110889 type:complete len:338 (-) Transcript_62201:579-1592(-)